jgi:hypothetical protein
VCSVYLEFRMMDRRIRPVILSFHV